MGRALPRGVLVGLAWTIGCARSEPAQGTADTPRDAAPATPAPPLEPAWTLDPGAPFELEVAVGSGSGGYVLRTLDGVGTWTMNRKRWRERFASIPEGEVCELGEGTLSPRAIDRLAQAIGDLELLELPPRIEDPQILDGTQWVLLVRQGPHRKRVAMSNRFPEPVRVFFELVELTFAEVGRDPMVWREGPCVRFPSEH